MLGCIFNLVALIVIAAVTALTYFFNPSIDKIFPPCPSTLITNLHCPACGALRALHALTHGNIAEAISQNLIAVILIPFVVIMAFLPNPFKKTTTLLVAIVIIVLFTIMRNTTQFSFLAPH